MGDCINADGYEEQWGERRYLMHSDKGVKVHRRAQPLHSVLYSGQVALPDFILFRTTSAFLTVILQIWEM